MLAERSEPSALLIAAGAPVAARILSALNDADIPAIAVTSVAAARELLPFGRPRGLVVSVHLGAHNGLHIVHLARQLHYGLPKIVIGEADPILEAEAERAGAQYVTEPVDPEAIVAIARRLPWGVSPPRRWRRLRPASTVAARVNGCASHVVDIGYGGIGLELPNEGMELPRAFEVELPGEGLTLAARSVWQQPHGERVRCGALLTQVAASTPTAWQVYVDRARLGEWGRGS